MHSFFRVQLAGYVPPCPETVTVIETSKVVGGVALYWILAHQVLPTWTPATSVPGVEPDEVIVPFDTEITTFIGVAGAVSSATNVQTPTRTGEPRESMTVS